MHTNRGIVIGVLCEGTLVDEYAHQSEDEYTASCFIPGDANKVGPFALPDPRTPTYLASQYIGTTLSDL